MAVHNNGEPKPHPLGNDSHDGSYEGSTTLYAKHLVEDHGYTQEDVAKYAGGMDQGAWIALDRLHRAARLLD